MMQPSNSPWPSSRQKEVGDRLGERRYSDTNVEKSAILLIKI